MITSESISSIFELERFRAVKESERLASWIIDASYYIECYLSKKRESRLSILEAREESYEAKIALLEWRVREWSEEDSSIEPNWLFIIPLL